MRFAGNSSNTNSFIAAGKAAAQGAENLFKVARENSPDYGMLATENMKARSKERQVATAAEAAVRREGIKALTQVKKTGIQVDAKEKILGMKLDAKRKAGIVGALGAVAGGGLMAVENNRAKKVQAERDAREEAKETQRLELMASMLKPDGPSSYDQWLKDNPKPEPYKPDSSGSESDSGSSSSSTSESSSGVTPVSNSAGSFDLSSLSEEDKRYIAYTVSGEAARGTDDEFGVAGVVINRMRSKNYPSTAKGVAHQPGQFEAVEKGMATFDPQLETRLFSPEGLKKLQSALSTLNGRDSFKGQALLKNRVKEEDPMFAPNGNFFHHSWQN